MTALQQRLFTVPTITKPSDEWYTPSGIIDAARATMGGIDLDPASSHAANLRVQAAQYYTLSDDGLAHVWRGNVWLNPPYSNPLPWMQRLADRGGILQYIALVPERLGVTWFNVVRDASNALCMFNERIRFVRADGRGTSSPNFGNFAFYGGDNVAAFAREFSKFGMVVTLRQEVVCTANDAARETTGAASGRETAQEDGSRLTAATNAAA